MQILIFISVDFEEVFCSAEVLEQTDFQYLFDEFWINFELQYLPAKKLSYLEDKVHFKKIKFFPRRVNERNVSTLVISVDITLNRNSN